MGKHTTPLLILGALLGGAWLLGRRATLTPEQIIANARAELEPLRKPLTTFG